MIKISGREINNPFLTKEFMKVSKNPSYNQALLHYYEQLHNIAISRFGYKGLPQNIDEYFMEDVLFLNGSGLMIYDENVQMFGFTSYSLMGELDAYGMPSTRVSYATPNYIVEFNKWNSVIFKDRPTGTPIAGSMWMYANCLANLWMTREINLNAMKTPIAIKAPKESQLSYEIMMKDVQNYVPVIKCDNDMDLDRIQVLKLDAPVIFDKIEMQMHQVKMQALSDLGFNVSAIDKKERLVSAETEQNNDENFGNRVMYLDVRKRACRGVEKAFGLKLEPYFRSQSYELALDFVKEEKHE